MKQIFIAPLSCLDHVLTSQFFHFSDRLSSPTWNAEKRDLKRDRMQLPCPFPCWYVNLQSDQIVRNWRAVARDEPFSSLNCYHSNVRTVWIVTLTVSNMVGYRVSEEPSLGAAEAIRSVCLRNIWFTSVYMRVSVRAFNIVTHAPWPPPPSVDSHVGCAVRVCGPIDLSPWLVNKFVYLQSRRYAWWMRSAFTNRYPDYASIVYILQ